MYITDAYNGCVRKVTISTGIITAIAGTGTNGYSGDNGPATAAALNGFIGIALDTIGTILLLPLHLLSLTHPLPR